MKENKEITIDIVQLFKILWKKKIAIILTAIVAAVLAFGVSSFVLTPEYSSRHVFMWSIEINLIKQG